MAVVCHICKEEVELINFGNGLVAVCCDRVLYNSADKSQFDMKPDEKKDISMHPFHQKRRSYQAKHS
ncbi:MAG: hypothetical protein ACXWMK_10225 [Syntrophales bacterium]